MRPPSQLVEEHIDNGLIGFGIRARREVNSMFDTRPWPSAINFAPVAVCAATETDPRSPTRQRCRSQCDPRIAGLQEDGRHLLVIHAGLLQRLDEQIVHLRAFVQRDLLPFQVCQRSDLGILRHRGCLRFPGLRARGTGRPAGRRGLREDRRRFAGMPDVDASDVKRLEQLRPAREFGPGHLVAVGFQSFFQGSFGFENIDRAVFLETDADFFGAFRRLVRSGGVRRAALSFTAFAGSPAPFLFAPQADRRRIRLSSEMAMSGNDLKDCVVFVMYKTPLGLNGRTKSRRPPKVRISRQGVSASETFGCPVGFAYLLSLSYIDYSDKSTMN